MVASVGVVLLELVLGLERGGGVCGIDGRCKLQSGKWMRGGVGVLGALKVLELGVLKVEKRLGPKVRIMGVRKVIRALAVGKR